VSTLVKPGLGLGAFSVPDIAVILQLPQGKVRRLLNQVWDQRLGQQLFGDTFSTSIGDHKYVNFHVLVEFYVYFELREIGVTAQQIVKARNAMRKDLSTEHPFATAHVLSHGKKVWYKYMDSVVNADGSRQTNFVNMVQDYAKKIDFNLDFMAERFWPLGKQRSVVVDPKHQFGAPTVPGTNINAQVLFQMSKSGERVESLAALYDLDVKDVRDAILLYERAA
jgi:uncharacterized protein (DUF433 family)